MSDLAGFFLMLGIFALVAFWHGSQQEQRAHEIEVLEFQCEAISDE